MVCAGVGRGEGNGDELRHVWDKKQQLYFLMHSNLFSGLCLTVLTLFADCVSDSHSAVHTALDRPTLSIKVPYLPAIQGKSPAVLGIQPSADAVSRLTN
jgi:hypothetical protein